MYKLERKWWFRIPALVIALLSIKWLMAEAGATDLNVAYYIVLFAGTYGMAQGIAIVAWLAVLVVAPKVATDKG